MFKKITSSLVLCMTLLLAKDASAQMAGGIYTINSASPTGSANFQSFTDAATALNQGITGPVIINVIPGSGPYTEQFLLTSATGSNATNTITINGNGNTLQYDLTATQTTRYTIGLDGADYVTIHDMNIVCTGTGNYINGCQLWNQAENDSLVNCTITASYGTYAYPVMMGNLQTPPTVGDNNNVLYQCTLNGGNVGCYCYGRSNSNGTANKIIECHVKNSSSQGLAGGYQDGLTIIGNVIERPDSANLQGFSGIYISSTRNAHIEKNIVRNPYGAGAGTGTSYTSNGIFAGWTSSTSVNDANKIYNNLIYGMQGYNAQYGINITSAPYTIVYHNTIVLDDAAATSGDTYGIYSMTGTGNDIQNNNIYITRGGTGNKYCLYFTGGNQVSDYNNLYINSPAGSNHIGYYNSNQTTLPNWQGANTSISWDVNSLSVNPLFTNMAIGNFIPTEPVLDDMGTYVNVADDLNDSLRNISAPDIGAYEFTARGCSNPIAGTVTASSAQVCLGQSVNLQLSGNSYGTGQTYQWESTTSLSSTTSWTPESGANPTHPITVIPAYTGVTYYRCIITCGATTVFSDTIQITVPVLFPSGSYTINSALPTGSSNFQSFADAINALKCGIAGPIIFNVTPGSGPYTEQLIIPSSIGFDAFSTLTINGNGATVQYNAGAAGEGVLMLDGADYVKIDSLTFKTLNTINGTGAFMYNGCDYDTLTRCTFDVSSLTSTVNSNSGIRISATPTTASATVSGADNTYIGDCKILGTTGVGGPYYGIYAYGPNNNNIYHNNLVSNFYYYGIFHNSADNATLSNNHITNETKASTTVFANGIYSTSATNGSKYIGNLVEYLGGATGSNSALCYPIIISSAQGSSSTPILVANNILTNHTTSANYGISVDGNYVDVYHNTINMDKASSYSGTISGIYAGSATSNFKNNLVNFTGAIPNSSKYGLYYLTAPASSDYNDVYVHSPQPGMEYFGYIGSASYTTLSAFQATAMDANSYDLDPMFVSGNVTPTNAFLDNTGTQIPSVTDDFYGTARNPSIPDIGAVEFTIPSCGGTPVAGNALVSQSVACLGQTVTLSLSGQTVATGLSYQWYSATSLPGTWIPEGSPQPSPVLTGVAPAATGTVYYRCQVSCGVSSTFSTEDSVMVPGTFPGGAYTINSATVTGGTNFQNFTDAINAMRCGITGPVEFNVAPGSGPYYEQITLPETIGSDVFKTLTINGNGNSLIHTPVSTQSQPYTLGMNGIDYVTVRNLNIVATGSYTANTYVYAAHLWNQADNDSFINCTFTAPLTTASSTAYSAFASGGSPSNALTAGLPGCNNIVLDSCIANGGGVYCIIFNGYNTDKDTANTVLNSRIKNFYTNGIYAYAQDNVLLSGNIIERPDSAIAGSFTGIYLNGNCSDALVEKNIIRYPFGGGGTATAAANGIMCAATAATAGNENKFYNNLIYGFEGNGTQYGMQISASPYVQVYHNTIVLDDNNSTAGSTRGIYSTTGIGNDFKNNNIYITREGSGAKYCFYFTGGSQTSDFNNLYINASAGTNAVGYYSNDRVTLASWQAANSSAAWDVNSISVDPMFVNTLTGNYEPSNPLFDNLGIPLYDITDDIYNNARSTVSPDMGAIENSSFPLPIRLAFITAKNVNARNRVDWVTVSEDDAAYFELERSEDGKLFNLLSKITANGKAGNYIYWDEAPLTATNYYRLKMITTSGRFTYSKVVNAFISAGNAFTVNVFPNPVTDVLTLRIMGSKEANAHVEIVDITGKVLKRQPVTEKETGISMKHLPNAIYFIRYTDAAHAENIRITKE